MVPGMTGAHGSHAALGTRVRLLSDCCGSDTAASTTTRGTLWGRWGYHAVPCYTMPSHAIRHSMHTWHHAASPIAIGALIGVSWIRHRHLGHVSLHGSVEGRVALQSDIPTSLVQRAASCSLSTGGSGIRYL